MSIAFLRMKWNTFVFKNVLPRLQKKYPVWLWRRIKNRRRRRNRKEWAVLFTKHYIWSFPDCFNSNQIQMHAKPSKGSVQRWSTKLLLYYTTQNWVDALESLWCIETQWSGTLFAKKRLPASHWLQRPTWLLLNCPIVGLVGWYINRWAPSASFSHCFDNTVGAKLPNQGWSQSKCIWHLQVWQASWSRSKKQNIYLLLYKKKISGRFWWRNKNPVCQIQTFDLNNN